MQGLLMEEQVEDGGVMYTLKLNGGKTRATRKRSSRSWASSTPRSIKADGTQQVIPAPGQVLRDS